MFVIAIALKYALLVSPWSERHFLHPMYALVTCCCCCCWRPSSSTMTLTSSLVTTDGKKTAEWLNSNANFPPATVCCITFRLFKPLLSLSLLGLLRIALEAKLMRLVVFVHPFVSTLYFLKQLNQLWFLHCCVVHDHSSPWIVSHIQ